MTMDRRQLLKLSGAIGAASLIGVPTLSGQEKLVKPTTNGIACKVTTPFHTVHAFWHDQEMSVHEAKKVKWQFDYHKENDLMLLEDHLPEVDWPKFGFSLTTSVARNGRSEYCLYMKGDSHPDFFDRFFQFDLAGGEYLLELPEQTVSTRLMQVTAGCPDTFRQRRPRETPYEDPNLWFNVAMYRFITVA